MRLYIYFCSIKNGGISKYNNELNELNRILTNFIYNTNSKFYTTYLSMSGLLKLQDLIKHISARFKFNFLKLKHYHPMKNLEETLVNYYRYDAKTLIYRISNYNIRKYYKIIYSFSYSNFLKELKFSKKSTLLYNKTSKLIESRNYNDMDYLIK